MGLRAVNTTHQPQREIRSMPATPISNRISLDIPPADVQAIRDAVQVLQDKLVPHLVALNTDDILQLPKMGPKTVDFVTKALDYSDKHPSLRPSFIDEAEFAKDLAAVDLLLSLQRPLDQVSAMVDSSLKLAGSEAFSAALAFYQSVKMAAKMGAPGAATIADDLSQRFPGRPRAAAPAPVPAAPTPQV
jgi:hypothetical protein